MNRNTKRAVISVSSVLGAVILAAAAYVSYVVLSYSRIEDGVPLTVENGREDILTAGTPHTVATYNIGFGAYGPEYSFFMDTGTMKDGTPVRGRYGKGLSKELTVRNTLGALGELLDLDPEFIFLQEADVKSSRAHGTDQYAAAKEAFPDMAAVYASNFHTPYLLYPFNDPHGKTEAGLVMMSDWRIDKAERRSYPVADDFTKYMDLDRCFAVARVPVDNGRELVLINSHMSAYDEGGTIRKEQWRMVMDFITSEYGKGNYVILGGDFNHVLGDWPDDMFPSGQLVPDWLSFITSADIPDHFSIASAENAWDVPTCRAADIPWTEGVNYTCIIDGFIVSDNIGWNTINIDTDFAWSDHQPVLMTFTLL